MYVGSLGCVYLLYLGTKSGGSGTTSTDNHCVMGNESSTILLVKQETSIPIPGLHATVLDPKGPVGAQFMLMDCLRGNVGMDLGMEIPDCHKNYVYSKMAEIQVRLSFISFYFLYYYY